MGEWPLPPIPGRHTLKEEHDFDDDDDCVEISHAELEDQAAQERHSFISGSSANEEEEEEVGLAGNSNIIWVFMVPSSTSGLWRTLRGGGRPAADTATHCGGRLPIAASGVRRLARGAQLPGPRGHDGTVG